MRGAGGGKGDSAMAAWCGDDRAKGSGGHQRGRTRVGPADDDEEVVEVDPTKRFHRYKEQVGTGRFKKVYRGYDTEEGVDVAWCKVFDFEKEQAGEILEEMQKGIALDHPNIIKCYACWECRKTGCINLVTELFTSGNLRDYRQHYRHLDQKALKKMGRQILSGLAYLHGLKPPVVHGDLRCDKIYVNGFNGEVKIGDLGLRTLLAKRYGTSTASADDFKTPPEDMYCFGLCLLELFTKVYVDRSVPYVECLRQLRKAKDEKVRDVIALLLGDADQRPVPSQLLESEYFRKPHVDHAASPGPKQPHGVSHEAGKLRGEDYNFVVQAEGEPEDGKIHFEITMTKEEDPETVQNVGFDYILLEDSPEQVADEMANSFGLSMTDKEICAAALREWLASRDLPCVVDPRH